MKSTVQDLQNKKFSSIRSFKSKTKWEYELWHQNGHRVYDNGVYWWSLSLMEIVKVDASIFNVNNEETITTMSIPFWFLMPKFKMVSNIILLHISKKKLLLETLKVEASIGNNRNKCLDKQRHIQNSMRHLGWSFLQEQLKGI